MAEQTKDKEPKGRRIMEIRILSLITSGNCPLLSGHRGIQGIRWQKISNMRKGNSTPTGGTMKTIPVAIALVLVLLTTSCAVTNKTPMFSCATAKSKTPVEPVDLSKLAQPRSHFTFTENTGQVDESVRFYSRITNGTVFITKTGKIVYELESLRLSEAFIGDSLPKVIGQDRIERKIQFADNTNPQTDRGPVVTYGMVLMEDVYPGINIILTAASSNVEKIIWIKPGASVKDISVEFSGAGGLSLLPEGNMRAQVGQRTLTFGAPTAYQIINGTPRGVPSSFVVNGNRYSFDVKVYDRDRDLFLK